METKIVSEDGTQTEIALTLPGKVLGDLKKIAYTNKTKLGDLLYSYIVDGITSDAFAIRRMKSSDKTSRNPLKNNSSQRTVEDLLENLVY